MKSDDGPRKWQHRLLVHMADRKRSNEISVRGAETLECTGLKVCTLARGRSVWRLYRHLPDIRTYLQLKENPTLHMTLCFPERTCQRRFVVTSQELRCVCSCSICAGRDAVAVVHEVHTILKDLNSRWSASTRRIRLARTWVGTGAIYDVDFRTRGTRKFNFYFFL